MKVLIALLLTSILFCGCSHNPGIITVGKRANWGFDPAQMAANVSFTDGLNIIDIPRENSSIEIEVDEALGIQWDPATNSMRGVKKITRKTGVQITGYLVDLAKLAPNAAEAYISQASAMQAIDGVKLSPHLVTLPLLQSNGTAISKLTLAKLKTRVAADTTTTVPDGLNMSLEDWKWLVAAYIECPECLGLTPEEEAALKEATGK